MQTHANGRKLYTADTYIMCILYTNVSIYKAFRYTCVYIAGMRYIYSFCHVDTFFISICIQRIELYTRIYSCLRLYIVYCCIYVHNVYTYMYIYCILVYNV